MLRTISVNAELRQEFFLSTSTFDEKKNRNFFSKQVSIVGTTMVQTRASLRRQQLEASSQIQDNQQSVKETTEQKSEKEYMCPVCYDELQPLGMIDEAKTVPEMFNNAMMCPNGHPTCISCVSRIASPFNIMSSEQTGIGFLCPICRAPCVLSRMHSFVMIKGSWRQFFHMFPEMEDMQEWMHQRPGLTPSASSVTVPSSSS